MPYSWIVKWQNPQVYLFTLGKRVEHPGCLCSAIDKQNIQNFMSGRVFNDSWLQSYCMVTHCRSKTAWVDTQAQSRLQYIIQASLGYAVRNEAGSANSLWPLDSSASNPSSHHQVFSLTCKVIHQTLKSNRQN
jgi:hypothetical protein